jgi:hypothetical protein
LAKGKQKKADPKASVNSLAAPSPMPRKEFEKELSKLQVELTRLQAWAVAEGARVIVVFEGRDTAGKGGVISRIMQRCSPRVFKHVALPTPSDREKSLRVFRQYNAPADFVETANTIGLPRYAKQAVDQQFARWVMLHVQSNPPPICTRPRVLVKGKRT